MNIKLHKRMEECPYTPHYHIEGNFTVCVLFSRHNIISVGFAKCNPNYDEFDEKRGREIALARAVKKLGANNGKRGSNRRK